MIFLNALPGIKRFRAPNVTIFLARCKFSLECTLKYRPKPDASLPETSGIISQKYQNKRFLQLFHMECFQMKDNRGHSTFNSVTKYRHNATKDKHLCDRPIISSLRATSSPIWASNRVSRERASEPRSHEGQRRSREARPNRIACSQAISQYLSSWCLWWTVPGTKLGVHYERF